MIKIITTGELQRKRQTRSAEYWKTLAPALTLAADGTPLMVDTDHPAYAAAAKLKPTVTRPRMDPAGAALIERQQGGCKGCGDSPLDGI